MMESRRGELDMVLKSRVQKGEINKRKGRERKGWERIQKERKGRERKGWESIQKGRKGMGSSILAVAEENDKGNSTDFKG